jgi:hypothetical protein
VFRWIGLALLGIVVAAAVSVAASRLASQQIGLASQPVSAGDSLVPAAVRKTGRIRHVQAHTHGHRRPQQRQRGTDAGKSRSGDDERPAGTGDTDD